MHLKGPFLKEQFGGYGKKHETQMLQHRSRLGCRRGLPHSLVPSGKHTHLCQIIWAKHTGASKPWFIYLFRFFLSFYRSCRLTSQTESWEGTVGLVEKVGKHLQVVTLISGQSRRPQPWWWLLEWGSPETGGNKLSEEEEPKHSEQH